MKTAVPCSQNRTDFTKNYTSCKSLFIYCGRGENLCSRGCWWSVVSCVARGVTDKMVVSRSQPKIWLALPGERSIVPGCRLPRHPCQKYSRLLGGRREQAVDMQSLSLFLFLSETKYMKQLFQMQVLSTHPSCFTFLLLLVCRCLQDAQASVK